MMNDRLNTIVDLLESKRRRYRVDTYDLTNIQKVYNFVDAGVKLLSFAQNESATVSDVFILYAVAMLGVSDRGGIQFFLKNVKKHHSQLNIADVSDMDALEARIRVLVRLGYLFSIKMEHLYYESDSASKKNDITYYIMTSDANELINHKLSRRVPYNRWLMALQGGQLVEWAACSFVGSRLCHHSNYVEYLDGHFQSKLLGKYFFPSEIKFDTGTEEHFVAILGAYLYQDMETQTDIDFLRHKITKINAIRNYLCVRAPKGVAEVVIVVDTKNDLMEMVETIEKTNTLTEYLPYIYFTGEGILAKVEYFEDAFFTMDYDASGEVIFKKTVPQFFQKN